MTWKTISTKNVYSNPWISVREDVIVNPAGQKAIYGVVEIPPGVFGVALDAKDHILLVKQHRYPTDITSWELPGGGLKKGNNPTEQMIEELAEEAHTQAAILTILGKTQTQPGVTTEIDVFFVATELKPSLNASDITKLEEGISETTFFSLAEIVAMIREGTISHAQTVTGIMLYLAYTGALEKL